MTKRGPTARRAGGGGVLRMNQQIYKCNKAYVACSERLDNKNLYFTGNCH